MLGWQPALCVWPSTSLHGTALFASLRIVESSHRPQMRAHIAAHGWPSAIAARRGAQESGGASADNKVCRECDKGFSALWVHRGVCSECEAAVRESGACPYQPSRCKRAWFCPHTSQCFVCDAHGCASCRLERGGADTVAEVASRLAASSRLLRIAIDFDRTLCNTRSGGAPIIGKHQPDEELLSLLWRHAGLCEIVTRNAHVQAIRAFLDAHGAPPADQLPIRTVRKGESKAEHVLAGLASEAEQEGDLVPSSGPAAPPEPEQWPTTTVLMVDDSVAELVEERVASDARVHRVLFVRLLL